MSDRAAGRPRRAGVIAAFAAIYVIWGSTYLGIKFAIETLPPFFINGARFVAGGVVLYAWARLSGAPAPTRREWGGGTITGALLFLCGTGAVVWAEHFIPSGVAALLVATEPMSFVLIDGVRRRRMPNVLVLAGLALGSAGLAILVGPGELLGGQRVPLGPAALLVVSTFGWAFGSLFSRGSRLPSSPLMATAVTLLAGGSLLSLLGVVLGELGRFDPAGVSTRSVLAVVYLFVFGAVVGFTAYLWLLRVASPSRISTYAYVNPVVAVVLGWALAGEDLTPRIFAAAAVIVGAVVLIIRHGGEASAVLPETPEPVETARA